MVLELKEEHFYIGIIIALSIVQIFQWRKIDTLERVIGQMIEDFKILGMAADIKFMNLEKKIDDEKKSGK
jgi:hypothetical protein